MSRRSEGQRGFSLVEVLCAVAIAASSIAVLTAGIGGSMRGAGTLDQHLGARIILQSILEDEIAAGNTAPDTRQGDSGPYRWTLDITPAPSPRNLAQGYRLYRLVATVGWGSGGQVSATALKLGR